MKQKIINLISISAIICLGIICLSTTAQAESLYGALFETGHLEADIGMNEEALLMYYPEAEEFIAVTSNDIMSEWRISDSLGTNWTLIDPSPIAEYGCVMPGRHTFIEYNGEAYFAASCGLIDDRRGTIFRLTSSTTAEVAYVRDPEGEGAAGVYPTGVVLNDKMYMFFDGGFTTFDGTTWIDTVDAVGQVAGVPLETSGEQDGYSYVAQTSGEVQKFDGISFETIGEDYLEGVQFSPDYNLPAIEVYNNTVYVGNQDFTNGATLFRYTGGTSWEEVVTLDAADTIINKMQLSDDSHYLVFYTSNADTGTNIYAIDEDDNLIQLIDSGLGGTNPENNNEVVSIVNRTVTDGGVDKQIMLFATQNQVDQTKIFAMNLDDDLAIDAASSAVISSAKKAYTQAGRVFTYKISKAKVKKGAVYSLWINGKKVDYRKATTKKKITLKYKGAKNKEAGDTFSVKIGVRYSYGQGDDQIKANNLIKGSALKVTVQRQSLATAIDLDASCPITLDNNTSDWDALDSLVSDEGSTIGTTYYYDGAAWKDSEPASYDYTTNVDQMADLENIKMCNDMAVMYLYVDAQHPMFGVYDVAAGQYSEFPDPYQLDIGGMPQEFDYWMVYEMQKEGSDNIYYYGIHLYSAVGDAGLEAGPTKQALYQDDGDGLFDPTIDAELAEFEGNDPDIYKGENRNGKEFDQEGGLEVAMYLVNKYGEGLFTSTDIEFGDTVNMSVAMYPNSIYASNLSSRQIQSVEQTDDFQYIVSRVGVQNVKAPNAKIKATRATIKWDSVIGASKYNLKLLAKNGRVLRVLSTAQTKKIVKNLTPNKSYKVRVRAKISSVYTPWSNLVSFKTD